MATLLLFSTALSTQMILKEKISIRLGTCGKATSLHIKEAILLEKYFKFSLWTSVLLFQGIEIVIQAWKGTTLQCKIYS